jgi:pimeloyl-ACP methyl ester carboxylesterase
MAMAMAGPEQLHVEVEGIELGVVRWRGRPGTPVVVTTHGITANAWSWSVVARHLDGDVGIVAIDLRGRGASSQAPGPTGMRRHADDVAAVIERLSAAPAVVVGHSMGAFVALVCAERHPATVAGLVLVDGGVPIPIPSDTAAGEALDAIVGPAIDRLRRVWPDRVSYRTMWSEHPAFAAGLTPEIERYVLSDLTPCEGGFRSVVSEAAVRFDGEELLVDHEMRTALERCQLPAVILRAETGLMGAPPPFVADEWVDRLPRHDWRLVPGTNHYSLLVGEVGAAAVAQAIRGAVGLAA